SATLVSSSRRGATRSGTSGRRSTSGPATTGSSRAGRSSRRSCSSSSTGVDVRLLNHLHGDVTERIRERYPEVDVVEVPREGDVDPAVTGDALLTVRALGRNIAQLAGRVHWMHNFGTGLDALPDEAFSVPVLTCA